MHPQTPPTPTLPQRALGAAWSATAVTLRGAEFAPMTLMTPLPPASAWHCMLRPAPRRKKQSPALPSSEDFHPREHSTSSPSRQLKLASVALDPISTWKNSDTATSLAAVFWKVHGASMAPLGHGRVAHCTSADTTATLKAAGTAKKRTRMADGGPVTSGP
jgi:hypothetical protein